MALALSGTSNGSLNNLSLTANTGTVVDTSVNPFLAYDSWYMTADHTTTANITSWSRRGSDYTNIGSAMTHSSGTFSFPTTGYWLIKLRLFLDFNQVADDQTQIYIRIGTSGTPDTNVASIIQGGSGVGDFLNQMSAMYLFDVTNTTNDVVAFQANSISLGNRIFGSSETDSTVEFIKLGNT